MGLRDRLTAWLADDGEPEPQARDRRAIDTYAFSDDLDRVDPDDDIETWVDVYYANPLIRASILTYTSDVLAPGWRITVEDDDGLEADLREWAGSAAISDGEFGHDLTTVLADTIKDAYGRRGTALIEHVYDDAEAQEELLALRPFRAETVTAYTRPGKNILLRPDDTDAEFDAERPSGRPDGDRTDIPLTKADDAAAYVQYDDIFGVRERDEVRLAQSQVTKHAHDTDTGDIFGRPDTASVADRAQAINDKLSDADQGITAKAYKYWLVNLPGVSKSQAESLLKDLDLDDPTTKSVTNSAEMEVESIDGEVPDIVDHLQFEVEYILSAMPIPLYKAGFAGDINRDVTSEQESDYEQDVRDERRELEAIFEPIIQAKARELAGGDADADGGGESVPDVTFEIAPDDADSPLEDDEFDAQAFKQLMAGLKQAAPGGAVEQVITPEAVVDQLLGMDPDDVMGDQGDQGDADAQPLPDESDPDVQAAFEDAFPGADLETDDTGES